MSIETYFAARKSGELYDERRNLLPEDKQFHYLVSEMVEPLKGAVITGGKVIGDGSPEEPHMPVLYVEQDGKRYTLVISSDDEMNDGGRILIERGHLD
jgi:hypothetical protein